MKDVNFSRRFKKINCDKTANIEISFKSPIPSYHVQVILSSRKDLEDFDKSLSQYWFFGFILVLIL